MASHVLLELLFDIFGEGLSAQERNGRMTDTSLSTRDRIVRYICDFCLREHMSPTVREICAGVGLPSSGSVHYHLKKLERDGTITWQPGKGRTIRINIPLQEGIPIVGTIAAGQPLDRYRETEHEFLSEDTTVSSKTIALHVKGHSMIDDCICDGDVIIVERDQPIRDGDIVVAMHTASIAGDGAATVKRFYRERRRIRLQPANAMMEPIYVDAAEWDREWQVYGKVVGLRRNWR